MDSESDQSQCECGVWKRGGVAGVACVQHREVGGGVMRVVAVKCVIAIMQACSLAAEQCCRVAVLQCCRIVQQTME